MIEIIQIPLGPLQTNCYLLVKKGKCLIVDPGSEGERLIEIIEEKSLQAEGIVLTHSHYDHIGAIDKLVNKYNLDLYIHENEASWLKDPEANGSGKYGIAITAQEADHFFKTDGEIEIASFKFNVLQTPGHSPGGVSFYFPEDKFVLTGDALFKGSIGRTDLYQSNPGQLLESIKSQLLVLPKETIVYPGHGPASSIEFEQKSNPFLK